MARARLIQATFQPNGSLELTYRGRHGTTSVSVVPRSGHVTVHEAARVLETSAVQVYRMIARGELSKRRRHRATMIALVPVAELRALLKKARKS